MLYALFYVLLYFLPLWRLIKIIIIIMVTACPTVVLKWNKGHIASDKLSRHGNGRVILISGLAVKVLNIVNIFRFVAIS